MNKLTFLLLFAVAFHLTSCEKNVEIDGIFYDFNKIEIVKNQIKKGDPKYLPAYETLLNNAEIALTEGPFSVTNKKRTPPNGDKHDYLSMGPYWWPDSTKPDGLPYIRRDGEVNPETHGEYVDTDSKNKLFANVETLGWAYYFSGEKKYAGKALQLLETWFVEPETRMNPNLNFAQGIPGICDGRGIGIIDWAGINKIISTIQILDAGGDLPKEIKTTLFSWFEEYHNWLTTHEYGLFEDNTKNNHGTWYDVQVTGIELMLGKTESAKARLEIAKTKRIASQIEPDGSQPHEIARTKSLSYSAMNLRGFMQLANLGKKAGVDLWNFETADGRSIRKALDFLLPVAAGEKNWEYQQLGNLEESIENLKINFIMAAEATGDEKYTKVSSTIKSDEKLLYPFD
jgi:hypothetical protein